MLRASCMSGRFTSGLLLAVAGFFWLSVLVQKAGGQAPVSRPTLEENRLQVETAYTLGPRDRLLIDIFNVLEEGTEFLVLVDGTVSLPLIGTVKVQGLTLAEATERITQRYTRYIKYPSVALSLQVPRPLQIAVSGEVNSPGALLRKKREKMELSAQDVAKRIHLDIKVIEAIESGAHLAIVALGLHFMPQRHADEEYQ